jgi:antitoxin component HigA of HigAB toxin-antitoxin module
MELNAITTEEECEAALNEVERLFELDSNSLDVAGMENLCNLIEVYEDKNYPIPKPNIMNRILYFFESRRFFHR